jgi:AcrR family transcriptional regulator
MPRVKAPDERRADLLRAAAKVLVSKGVDGATVADITNEAGVAKGTFYLYFDSKGMVLRDLRLLVGDELRSTIAALAMTSGSADWWSLADRTLRTIIEFWLSDRELHRIVLAGPGDVFETLADHERSMEADLVRFIRMGVDAGVASCPDPPMTARLMIHAVNGLVYHAIVGDEAPDAERLVAATIDLFHRALRPSHGD